MDVKNATMEERIATVRALHCNLEEHLSREQYRQLLRVAAVEGCNYFTFNIPNTICNECGHIDKRYLHKCPECGSENVDYLTRVIGYMKRVSNFSAARQKEAARRIPRVRRISLCAPWKSFSRGRFFYS